VWLGQETGHSMPPLFTAVPETGHNVHTAFVVGQFAMSQHLRFAGMHVQYSLPQEFATRLSSRHSDCFHFSAGDPLG